MFNLYKRNRKATNRQRLQTQFLMNCWRYSFLKIFKKKRHVPAIQTGGNVVYLEGTAEAFLMWNPRSRSKRYVNEADIYSAIINDLCFLMQSAVRNNEAHNANCPLLHSPTVSALPMLGLPPETVWKRRSANRQMPCPRRIPVLPVGRPPGTMMLQWLKYILSVKMTNLTIG